MNSSKRLISPVKHDPEVKKAKLNEPSEFKENLDFLFDDDDGAFDLSDFVPAKPKLDLSQWQRCRVGEVQREQRSFNLILQVSCDKEADKVATCHLQGQWAHLQVAPGDVISVLARWDEQLTAYKVDNDYGFCVTNPDDLISGTSVVGSLFCRRKAVLQDRFRGVDANSKVMVIGTLVHELLQIVLTKGLKTQESINAVACDLLQSKETAYTLYASQLTREETETEVQKFVPNIVTFMQHYVEGREATVQLKDNFQGRIAHIQDIEENLWVPQLGLKGKVDVSVRIHRRRPRGNALKFEPTPPTQAIPLELKTGRATFSMEHKGQVLLYQMMLTAAGRETNSGLLLYLREGIMREVPSRRNEQRDLVMLRNELSRYLTQAPAALSSNNGVAKVQQPMQLPEPISHHCACNSCAYATICCAFAKNDATLDLREGHPLRKVWPEAIGHLSARDYEYFMHWCGLLALEEHEAKQSNQMRTLWTETPEHRQRMGRALLGLTLKGDATFDEYRYLQTFELSVENNDDLTLRGFSVGDYVIVSCSRRLAIAAGCIAELCPKSLAISLERDLSKNYAGETFIVDKHESQSGNVFNFTNLGLLLDATERSCRLRAIVIERQQPQYSKLSPQMLGKSAFEIIKDMNSKQKMAVSKALTTDSYMLIKGLPGTGKTQTLVAIVRMMHLLGKSVLITSHTHSAVDNLLLRLRAHDLPMLRLGSAARTNPQLRPFSEAELMKDCSTEVALAAKYAAYNIVGVTCLGASHSLFLHRKFDYCIVDEATQVLQPTVLRPLCFADKFILVGDPDQLPPLIRSMGARAGGADESLFARLDSDEATAVLSLQYRMNKTITKLANELTYGGRLKCGTDDVGKSTIKGGDIADTAKWVNRALQSHVDMSVYLLDTMDCSERSSSFAASKHSRTCAAIEQSFAEDKCNSTSNNNSKSHTMPLTPTKQKGGGSSTTSRRISKYTNYCEAAVIFHLVKVLLTAGYDGERIGIIAPYRAQVELLRKLAAQHHSRYAPSLNFSAVEVNTVDQYQGRDKDIILYSCAKTGPAAAVRDGAERLRDAEILEDKRRLTVAITRAKKKLLLIGDASSLQAYTPFRKLLSHIPGLCKMQLIDGRMDFKWQSVFDELSEVIVAGG